MCAAKSHRKTEQWDEKQNDCYFCFRLVCRPENEQEGAPRFKYSAETQIIYFGPAAVLLIISNL